MKEFELRWFVFKDTKQKTKFELQYRKLGYNFSGDKIATSNWIAVPVVYSSPKLALEKAESGFKNTRK